ncbi:uncharacterized protein Z520_01261 [Fonsecaea multimorphosa CBS 102226]|uniref:Major facilitator superfamily (MFS) profile domain-containing protein n=1 Tax=Fonsecaea multimorphosa CBS 102226 TaxID=1442371 RepID=A0A0D2HLM6_9EURO|nr:uncharacterized protein Z520_01261 [Fonsecaea multimorphosa CBS 102226]KIY02796.1 hypothetical protein Z520_01261 [Fonsecaea multimorphosa CBS 102226]
MKRQPVTVYNVAILFFVSLGSMSFGWAASIISTTLAQPSFLAYFQLDTRPDGTDLISTMNGLFQAGAVIGSLAVSPVADRWGRKAALASSAIIIIISGACLAGSTSVAMFIVFRFFSGLGSYMILTATTIWMSEVVPPAYRGALMDISAFGFELGYTSSTWVGFGFYFWKSKSGDEWRPPLALQCLWPLILLLGLPWVPESPRYLILKDRVEEAQKVLERLHHRPGDPDLSFARTELYQIRKQIAIDRTLPSSWIDMFRKPSYRKRTLFALGTIGIVQCSGVLVINNYGPSLYSALGFSTAQQLLYQCGWITMSLGLATMAMPLIDMFPRPRYFSFGIAFCMACLIVEAAIISNFGTTLTNHAALRAGVAMFFVYQIGYCVFLDSISFTYVTELFPTHLRAKGASMGIAMLALMNIIWLQAAPTAFENIGWKFYLCFIIPCSLGGLLILFKWPDTRGLPLEEVAALFGDADEVAVYQREIEFDGGTHTVIDHHNEKGAIGVAVEQEDVGRREETSSGAAI